MAGKATKYEPARIIQSGMGGFLNPPGHPEHTTSVETDLRWRPENRGRMSLTAASKCGYIDPAIRAKATRLLTAYVPPDIASDEGRTWARSVLGYFRGCYRNPQKAGEDQWHAAHVDVDSNRDPLANADDHAGVHWIRKWYPEFRPTKES